MQENGKALKRKHNLIMEDRKTLTLTGISDVDSFDEQTVVLITDIGELIIKGDSLQIKGFSVESGELSLEGRIDSLSYQEVNKNNGGFFPDFLDRRICLWSLP